MSDHEGVEWSQLHLDKKSAINKREEYLEIKCRDKNGDFLRYKVEYRPFRIFMEVN